LLFIDLRDRTDQRRKFQEEKKEKSDKDLRAELKRKAKDTIDAEMAQLEKRWQCSCLSTFANQCCKGLLMRLLPLNAQLRFRRESTSKQIMKDTDKERKKLDDKDKSQLDDEEKTVQEVTARRNVGEKRIHEAKIEWLKDCGTIMHKDPTRYARTTRYANPTDTLEDLEERLRAAGAADAKACDDVCTVAFFMAVRSMEYIAYPHIIAT